MIQQQHKQQQGQKRKLDDEFEKLAKIGQGSYGVVYKVRRKKLNTSSPSSSSNNQHNDDNNERDKQREIVALKRVKLNDNSLNAAKGLPVSNEGIPSSSLREIAALKNLKHPNVLELYEVIHTGSSIYLVFEYLDQDLKKSLNATKNGLSEKLAKNYLFQLLNAISYCHSRRIIHRDLKLQNLLINHKDGTIKLADFGLARNFSLPLRVYTKEVVTLWYRAPELLLGCEVYGPAVDIWSLGCIFFEMLTKDALFPGDSEIDQLFQIFQVLGTPSEKQWVGINKLSHFKAQFPRWPTLDLKQFLGDECPSLGKVEVSEISDLISKMLLYDPFKRISAQDAMKHSYFGDMTNKRSTLKNIQDPSTKT